MGQTAVEQLKQEFFSYADPYPYFSEEDKWVITEREFLELIEKVKAIEKEQIKDAYDAGNRKGYDEHILSAMYDLDEEYYNETFKNK